MNAAGALLLPLSWLYGAVVAARNFAYDRGLIKVEKAGVPVICVGNMTAGGTGKTPFVEYLVRFFLGRRGKVVVLSRGYRRTSSSNRMVGAHDPDRGNAADLGDEPYQMARKFPAAGIVVAKRRAVGAREAVRAMQPDVIVLDDGFSHRALGRDLDIVMVDARVPLHRIAMLPAGLRREPLGALRRARVVALSRSRAGDLQETPEGALVLKVDFPPRRIVRAWDSSELPASGIGAGPAVAFCGIGSPASFRETLAALGVDAAELLVFPDHRRYTGADIGKIEACMKRHGAAAILTTEKDAVRLPPAAARSLPVWYVEIEAAVTEGEEALHRMLNEVMERKAG